MTLKRLAKIGLKFISCRTTDIIIYNKHRRYWSRSSQQNYKRYFDEYKTRAPIIEELGSLLVRNDIDSAKIIEFGCSGGNNLKLMREILKQEIEYCGLDIQKEAIEFARQEFPNDRFYMCADTNITSITRSLGRFHVFLIAAVLYYIPQREAQIILNCAAEIADYVIICDYLDRFDLVNGENNGLFLHPYRYMCEHAGIEVVITPHALNEGNRHGLFIGRSLRKPTGGPLHR
jgi:hypothetical protein